MLNFTAIILYFIILGDCMEQLTSAFAVGHEKANKSRDVTKTNLGREAWLVQMVSHRTFWILLIAGLLSSVIFNKRLAELKGISYLFLGMMISFLMLMSAELFVNAGKIELTYE